MPTLFEALNAEAAQTENGMKTNVSSLDSNVDLFFRFGASRGKDIIPDFSKAFAEDSELATRIALWGRDIGEGAGERQLFKDILKYLIDTDKEIAIKVLNKISELGRFDDLYVTFETKIETNALEIIKKALLKDENGLCAKWMDRKGKNFETVRKYLEMTPKQYRKLIVRLTKVVEQQMCANRWSEIEYKKVPSLASSRYSKAFSRHDQERYSQYIESLKKGETTVNAGAVYPYDIVKNILHGNVDLANEQWKALPNYCKDSNEKVLTVIDTSGSMDVKVSGRTRALDIAISLGLYLSERFIGYFKDSFITFSERPELQHVKGSLSDRIKQLVEAHWCMNTNLEEVFNLVLSSAKEHNIHREEMPTMILIISDMEFDQGVIYNKNASKLIEQYYNNAGYEMPKIVFWNVNARSRSNVPATVNQKNIGLISGFSPSIMKSILSGKDFSPRGIMLETIMKDRYNF